MTELDIERERREFIETTEEIGLIGDFCMSMRTGEFTNQNTVGMFKCWLAAKRAVLGSVEPVAEMCVSTPANGGSVLAWFKEPTKLPVGTKLYTAPPAPVSAEPSYSLKELIETQEKFYKHGLADGRAESAPPSTDAKDSERLDWLDKQNMSYGFEDFHEGNFWSVQGAYNTIRECVDVQMVIAAKEAGTK